MPESHVTTIHGLRDLIERTVKEYAVAQLQAGNTLAGAFSLHTRGLADHIAKTIIGESFELELVRKMRPMVREHGALMRLIGSVAKDFLALEEDDEKMIGLQGWRPKEEAPL